MKKLALALMCLVSVAFFASCDPTEKNPSIAVNSGEGYLTNGQTIEMETEYAFGFNATSNLYTNKELYRLVVTVESFNNEGASIDKQEWFNELISGTTYSYTGTLKLGYNEEKDELIGTSVITAVVTDAAGETASAEIKVNVNDGGGTPSSQQLLGQAFSWVRKGLTLESADEMAKVGLTWPGNWKEDFIHIRPLANCSMYVIDNGDKYNEITTVAEKAAFFADLQENSTPNADYSEISAWKDETAYNTMVAVIDAEGATHLVHFTYATVKSGDAAGGIFTISGELK